MKTVFSHIRPHYSLPAVLDLNTMCFLQPRAPTLHARALAVAVLFKGWVIKKQTRSDL